MARCLIIGCGCRGSTLARALLDEGHVVRGTTRDAARRGVIEAAGAQCTVADPDRLGTMIGALDHVTVAVILLGSAEGSPETLAELHGPRLQALLTRMVDSTIKGVVYEARGSVDRDLLEAGAVQVEAFKGRSRARIALLGADPGDHEAWLGAAVEVVREVLAAE